MNFATIPKYCINLARRPDRREHAEKEFARLGLDVEFVAAIDARDIQLPAESIKTNYDATAQYACTLSHLSIIKRATAEYIFICEDDVIFRNDLVERMRYVERAKVDWDICYVGGWYQNKNDFEQIDRHLYRVRTMAGAHAYILKNTTFDFIIRNLTYDYGMDEFLTLKVLSNFKGVTYLPMMASTIRSFSDIAQRETDYNQTFKVF